MRLNTLKKLITNRGLTRAEILHYIETLENTTFSGHWHLTDIIDRGEENGYTIPHHDAVEIAKAIESNFNASIGINWDVIDYHIENYFLEIEEWKFTTKLLENYYLK